MSAWKVIDKGRDLWTDTIMNIVSFGAYGALGEETNVYIVENKETEERKTVIASDSYELGEHISDGDWYEEY